MPLWHRCFFGPGADRDHDVSFVTPVLGKLPFVRCDADGVWFGVVNVFFFFFGGGMVATLSSFILRMTPKWHFLFVFSMMIVDTCGEAFWEASFWRKVSGHALSISNPYGKH